MLNNSLQVSAPFNVIIQGLSDNNINYELLRMNPAKLNPTQTHILGNEIKEFPEDKVIYVDQDNKIIDGHKHFRNSIALNKPEVYVIRLRLPFDESRNILEKQQMLWDSKEKENMNNNNKSITPFMQNSSNIQEPKVNEVIGQDSLNMINDKSYNDEAFNDDREQNDITYTSTNDDKNKDKPYIDTLTPKEKNSQTIIGYRDKPINENSPIGNFFLLKPVEGFSKYEIDLDNLLDVSDYELDEKKPFEELAYLWFPHLDFEKVSKEKDVDVENIYKRCISQRLKELGFDGIKYNSDLLQCLG